MLRNAHRTEKIFPVLKSLYLILDIATVLFPIILSFDKRVYFFQHWKSVAMASLVVAIPFIAWDIAFTELEVWSFNPTYLTGITIYNLPVEEVLFFFVVPFACTFIYECCKYYFKRFSFQRFNQIFAVLFFSYFIFIGINANVDTWYTISVLLSTPIIYIITIRNSLRMRFLWITFAITLVPFLLVNGILTGSTTDEAVVIYNDARNINLRIGTIPFEDILYSFTLLLSVILLHEFISKKNRSAIRHT